MSWVQQFSPFIPFGEYEMCTQAPDGLSTFELGVDYKQGTIAESVPADKYPYKEPIDAVTMDAAKSWLADLRAAINKKHLVPCNALILCNVRAMLAKIDPSLSKDIATVLMEQALNVRHRQSLFEGGFMGEMFKHVLQVLPTAKKLKPITNFLRLILAWTSSCVKTTSSDNKAHVLTVGRLFGPGEAVDVLKAIEDCCRKALDKRFNSARTGLEMLASRLADFIQDGLVKKHETECELAEVKNELAETKHRLEELGFKLAETKMSLLTMGEAADNEHKQLQDLKAATESTTAKFEAEMGVLRAELYKAETWGHDLWCQLLNRDDQLREKQFEVDQLTKDLSQKSKRKLDKQGAASQGPAKRRKNMVAAARLRRSGRAHSKNKKLEGFES